MEYTLGETVDFNPPYLLYSKKRQAYLSSEKFKTRLTFVGFLFGVSKDMALQFIFTVERLLAARECFEWTSKRGTVGRVD